MTWGDPQRVPYLCSRGDVPERAGLGAAPGLGWSTLQPPGYQGPSKLKVLSCALNDIFALLSQVKR